MHAPDIGRRRTAAGLLAASLALTLLFAGCGQDGRELAAPTGPAAPAQDPTTTEPPTTEPPTTEPPTTERPPTTEDRPTTTEDEPTTTSPEATTTTQAGDDGDDSDVDWGLIAIIGGIGLAVILLLWLIISAVSRRGREHDVLDRRIAHLVGGAQWVHDQASLELMSGSQSPDRLRAGWVDTRRRINDLAAQASEAAVSSRGDVAQELRQLAAALGGLEGAVDTHVDLRLQSYGDAASSIAVNESAETVNERRHDLRAAIAPLAARL
jgi:hypothetical protein